MGNRETSGQREQNSHNTRQVFLRGLIADREILVQFLAGGRPTYAEAVIKRLAGVASGCGYSDIGRIAEHALQRLLAVGSSQSMLPYVCQLAVEIDRTLAEAKIRQ